MSATNRGSERIIADAYYTPISVIDNFLDHYELTTTRERERDDFRAKCRLW